MKVKQFVVIDRNLSISLQYMYTLLYINFYLFIRSNVHIFNA